MHSSVRSGCCQVRYPLIAVRKDESDRSSFVQPLSFADAQQCH
jgi:hypothetical protein